METLRDNSLMKDGTVVIWCGKALSVISQKYALWAIYKSKVAEDEANEAALIATDGWNGQVQALMGKDIDPDRHDEEQNSHRGKLEIDVLDKAHYGEWKDHGRRDLHRLVFSTS